MGLFLVPELRRAGGEVEPEPLVPLAMTALEVATVLMGMGATADDGLMSSVDVAGWWWWWPGEQLRWLLAGSTKLSEPGEKGE